MEVVCWATAKYIKGKDDTLCWFLRHLKWCSWERPSLWVKLWKLHQCQQYLGIKGKQPLSSPSSHTMIPWSRWDLFFPDKISVVRTGKEAKDFVLLQHIILQTNKWPQKLNLVYCNCGSVKDEQAFLTPWVPSLTCWLTSKYHNNSGDHVLVPKITVPVGQHYKDRFVIWMDL